MPEFHQFGDEELMIMLYLRTLILKAAVEREKAVQAIDVQRELKNCVVTFWVMSQFFNFLGASRDCADFRDPTAVFRLNKMGSGKSSLTNIGELE